MGERAGFILLIPKAPTIPGILVDDRASSDPEFRQEF
jgi:hypothetical protein